MSLMSLFQHALMPRYLSMSSHSPVNCTYLVCAMARGLLLSGFSSTSDVVKTPATTTKAAKVMPAIATWIMYGMVQHTAVENTTKHMS